MRHARIRVHHVMLAVSDKDLPGLASDAEAAMMDIASNLKPRIECNRYITVGDGVETEELVFAMCASEDKQADNEMLEMVFLALKQLNGKQFFRCWNERAGQSITYNREGKHLVDGSLTRQFADTSLLKPLESFEEDQLTEFTECRVSWTLCTIVSFNEIDPARLRLSNGKKPSVI